MARGIERIAVVTSGVEGAMGHSVKRGFEALGRTCELVPYMDWLPRMSGFRGAGALSKGLAGLGRPALELRLIANLTRLQPDLVLFLKSDDLHGATYAALRRVLPRARLVAYHPDDPWNQGGLTRRGPAHRRATLQLRRVDAAFLWSRALVERASVEGLGRVAYLPFACDPVLHRRVAEVSPEDRARLGAEVCFIGNWDEERERWLGPLADAGLGLALWGTDYWRDRCRHEGLRRAWRGRPLLGEEQAIATASSAIVVNVLRRQNKGACNMRTFEIPCLGGFMLHERSDEAEAFFPAETACGTFGSPSELVSEVRRWLADPAGRARIAAEGHARALRWTYREWALAMLEALGAAK